MALSHVHMRKDLEKERNEKIEHIPTKTFKGYSFDFRRYMVFIGNFNYITALSFQNIHYRR